MRKAHAELEMRILERTLELALTNEKLQEEIEERKRAEAALQQSTEKLKFFAYSLTHDLKSPTVAAHGLTRRPARQYGELMDEKGNQYCDQILKTSEHIAELVEKINLFVASKESPLRVETIGIREIARTIRDEFSVRLEARHINWLEPGSDLHLRADRLSILRVLRNFVDNALKYGGEELQEIRIDWEDSEECYVLSVRDDGKGTRQEDTRTAFEPFHRNETSTGTQGTGLGLAIVREIAELHGGTACAQPAKGNGVTFCVSISKDL